MFSLWFFRERRREREKKSFVDSNLQSSSRLYTFFMSNAHSLPRFFPLPPLGYFPPVSILRHFRSQPRIPEGAQLYLLPRCTITKTARICCQWMHHWAKSLHLQLALPNPPTLLTMCASRGNHITVFNFLQSPPVILSYYHFFFHRQQDDFSAAASGAATRKAVSTGPGFSQMRDQVKALARLSLLLTGRCVSRQHAAFILMSFIFFTATGRFNL